MTIYTGTGDDGETGIVGGRVSKSNVKVDAYGTIEEANSFLGLAIAFLTENETDIKTGLINVQHALFDCGSDLSFNQEKHKRNTYKINKEMVNILEQQIDAFNEETPALERFILPGGTQSAAYLHVGRTIVRRAERRVVQLATLERVNPFVLKYLNRLSDYLFTISRVANARANQPDIEYERGGKVFRNIGKGEDEER